MIVIDCFWFVSFRVGEHYEHRWKLLDKIIQQVVLQEQGLDGEPIDHDVHPLTINVDQIVTQ